MLGVFFRKRPLGQIIDRSSLCLMPHQPRPQRRRFYVIFRAPGDPDLLGIWHGPWRAVEAQLPTGQLFGSGVSLRGFDGRAEAEACWEDHHPGRAPVHRVAED